MNQYLRIKSPLQPFHLVKPSPWPIFIAFTIFSIVSLSVSFLHFKLLNCLFFQCLFLGVFVLFIFGISSWFFDIISEALMEGRHTLIVQRGLRLGFILFIVSEIIFFFSFFWTFFHSSVSPSIWIGAMWPPLGIQPINPWGLPLLNTVILLLSGVTVTWAHKVFVSQFTSLDMYQKVARLDIFIALLLTIGLGIFFTCIQLYEYQHAAFAINDGIYGSTFYILTGFHGFHVLIGTIFLSVCLYRHYYYHFSFNHHLGLEIAIWYWHFVDIVWIFLFICVYVWGS